MSWLLLQPIHGSQHDRMLTALLCSVHEVGHTSHQSDVELLAEKTVLEDYHAYDGAAGNFGARSQARTMTVTGQKAKYRCEQMFSVILPGADIRQGMSKAYLFHLANHRMRHGGGDRAS
jgi:hypothetical protein